MPLILAKVDKRSSLFLPLELLFEILAFLGCRGLIDIRKVRCFHFLSDRKLYLTTYRTDVQDLLHDNKFPEIVV